MGIQQLLSDLMAENHYITEWIHSNYCADSWKKLRNMPPSQYLGNTKIITMKKQRSNSIGQDCSAWNNNIQK